MKRKVAANEQLQQVRANARKQVADVKQQIEQIQQQSLVNMQHFISKLFRESNAANMQQLTDAMNAARQGLDGNTAADSAPVTPPDQTKLSDPGQEALRISQIYVQQAMESAGGVLKQTEEILEGLNKQYTKKP